MKFIADINISPKVVATLRARGHDVTRCDTFLPSTAEDHEIAALASKQGAAIITRDQDFAAILAMARASAPSIVNVRLVRTDAAFVAATLDAVLVAHAPAIAAGSVVTVEEGGVRIHRLPIGSG